MKECIYASIDCKSTFQSRIKICTAMWNLIYPRKLLNGQRRDYLTVNFNWGGDTPKAHFLANDNYGKHISDALCSLFADFGWNEHIQAHKMLDA
ncbi:hypothetical protein EYZ11_010483 [Aspergillus tanneri]|uniref:Uncharacterized protein n=1 Tax=Aspergillus tanneri TaxID=1220188 RepID=A0A4S3J7E8_9EURO|nr:hypothetical protein EYZ11_010483 [Aspergillus tanneri]